MNKREKELISGAALDLATGNYLLRHRTEEELAMLSEVCETLDTQEDKRTERQKEIYEEYRLCTDYSYWKSKNKEDNEGEDC